MLTAVPFDLGRLEVAGPPIAVADGVAHANDFGRVEYDVSDNGTLVFLPGGDTSIHDRLVWADRRGIFEPVTSTARLFLHALVSPDGLRILTRIGGANDSAWIYDIRRDNFTRLTFKGNLLSAAWTADGQRVVYSLGTDLGILAADGSGREEVLYHDEATKGWARITPDGQTIVFQTVQPKTGFDIWTLSTRTRQTTPWLATPFGESNPHLSPDGHWVAYVSNESSRSEIYVRPLHGAGVKTPVSRNGGEWPVWGPDGRELFFVEQQHVMKVNVTIRSDGALETDRPAVVFALRKAPAAGIDPLDITPDGKRFLLIEALGLPMPAHANVIVGWSDEVKKKALAR